MAINGFFDDDVVEAEEEDELEEEREPRRRAAKSAVDEDDDDDEVEDEDEEEEKPVARKAKAKKEDEEEDEIEIVEDPRGWEKDPATQIDDPKDAEYKGRIKKRFGHLTAVGKELARERDVARKTAAENEAYAKKLVAENAILQAQVSAGNVSSFETNVAAAKAGIKAAEGEYRRALAAGDAEAATSAQSALAEANARAINFEQRASDAKVHKTRTDAAAQKAVKEYNTAAADANRAAAEPQGGVTPQLRIKWFQKNPWFDVGGKDEMSRYALYMAAEAESELGEADTPEYFTLVDKAMKRRYPDYFGVSEKTEKRSTTVRSERVAPSQRTNTGAKNKLKLTKSQLATAQRLGIDTRSNSPQLKAYALECFKAEKRLAAGKA